MRLLERYSGVLRGTGAAPALAASLLGRLALGTTGLALLVLVRATSGSYATAGAVAAAYAVSFAGFAPVRARSADRSGPRPVLVWCSLTHPVLLVVLLLLARAEAALPVLLAAAVAAGATVPPVGGVMRALWGTLAERDERVDLTTAYSLESVVIELCFVGGPLLVAGLGAVYGPSAAVLASGALVLSGGLALAVTPAVRAVRPHDVPRARGGPLASPAVRALLLTVALVGAGFGAVEVAVVAFAEAQGGRPSTGGILLAVWSAGSIAGGLVYGAVHSPVPHHRQLPVLVMALAVASLLPALATSSLTMGLLLVLYGCTIAPYSACNSVLLGRNAPPGTATEAFAWSGSAIFGGAALGNVLSGLLVEGPGVRWALLLTGATGVLALLGTVAGRRALVPAT